MVTEIDISKCKIVSFGRHVDKNYEYNIKENNQITPLEYEESYKDLGVIFDFDEKLTFQDHIRDKVHKFRRRQPRLFLKYCKTFAIQRSS